MGRNSISFLDAISIASFLIGLENLDMNITQEDVQGSEMRLYSALSKEVSDIHKHLEAQDKKLDNILGILKENGGVVYDR